MFYKDDRYMTIGEDGISKTRLVNVLVREELSVTVNSKFSFITARTRNII